MYFKKLELCGFKSFYHKTTLHFEPGLTAIVGPNGCGKSNIFDGIRWVLGEQSVKELRGSQMQDVIFNGTDSKEPLSMAEVTLTFDNSQKFFPIDQDEVAITRRLFRSGESEYLLNKSQVRLKDILDLLAGTGIGAESYSLIQQGKIDLILSSKPEDRRLVFDEAAGITKYKTQKKEAIRKLEETQQNLLRVNDIINEVKRQISSLERQANKARRYKEVFEELKAKEINLAILQKNSLEKQKGDTMEEIRRLEEEESQVIKAIQEQESKINGRQQELKKIEEGIMEIKDRILHLDNLILRNTERISFDKEKIGELESAKGYDLKQIEQIKARLSLDEDKLNNFKAEYDGIRKNISEKSELLKTKENELANILASIKFSLDNIAVSKKNIFDLAAKIVSAKNEISDLSAQQQIYEARRKRLEIEKAKVAEEKSQIEGELENILREVKTLEADFNELGLGISRMQNEVDEQTLSLNKSLSEIEGLEREKISLQSQKAFLDELKTKYEDINESMEAVIYLDKQPQEKASGLVIRIRDFLNLDNSDRQLNQFANFKLKGEAKPIDLDTRNISEKIEQIELKIESLQKDRVLKEERLTALKQSILKAQESLRSQEMLLVNKKAQQQTISEQFNKIKEEEEIVSLELSDLNSQISVLQEKYASINICLCDLEGEQKKAEEAIRVNQDNINSQNTLKEGVVVAIAQIKTELESLNKRIASDESTLKILEDSYNQDKTVLLNLERQVLESEARIGSLNAEIKDLENKINEARKDIENQNILLHKEEARYLDASNESVDVIKKIESDRRELDNIKNRLHNMQMLIKDMDFKYQSMRERVLQAYKIELDSFKVQVEASVDTTTAVTDTAIQPQGVDENTLIAEIEALKDKLDSYGNVNLVAIEEYDELKKRYDFLTQQQSDLTTAKDSLHDAILKINRTTKKMFLETFEQVGQEFRNYFRLLFNGGDAQLFLVDEQEPLDSGIEIICRPPGKKLQNVLLLSGGEKSLAAIALIFAIFKVKPSPFCVLDEIDAALDEANVDRYSRILQDFLKTSQFIVITHNKKTIANADVMYGITMEESGVSKIVSVKFANNKDKGLKTQPQTQPQQQTQAQVV